MYIYIQGFPSGSAVKNPPVMQKMRVWFLAWEDPLEKETATHSSILAWKIPWTEEPDGLQSRGHRKVGHNFTIEQQFCGKVLILAWHFKFVRILPDFFPQSLYWFPFPLWGYLLIPLLPNLCVQVPWPERETTEFISWIHYSAIFFVNGLPWWLRR